MIGALPLYLKDDSFGEFVFDWSWADAYERAGRSYYPKLVSAIPFTPATGRRLLIRDHEANVVATQRFLLEALRELALELDVSSAHVLFPTESERRVLEAGGFLRRKACQFHWHNAGYGDFDDFLASFSSAKRKKAQSRAPPRCRGRDRFEHLRGDEPSSPRMVCDL